MKDDLRYTPRDCFETFPPPRDFEQCESLHNAGNLYYEFRAGLMQHDQQGLTTIYNRFHDLEEDCAEISRLRELHGAMDRAVLDAYGWNDIRPVCQFIPEFVDEDLEDENGRPKKKKCRYRWPDDARDEVLARLLEVNRQRALEEGQVIIDEKAAALDAKIKKLTNGKRNPKKAKKDSTSNLFALDQEEG